MPSNRYTSIQGVIDGQLCIGCGLCEAMTDGRAKMTPTQSGSLRPLTHGVFNGDEQQRLLDVCPGIRVDPRQHGSTEVDEVWGETLSMQYAWAGQPDIRYQGATGGVLTALGCHLLTSGQVSFILHVRSVATHPARSESVISETPQAVRDGTGSRYGPVAPLTLLLKALARKEKFAIIAKPCDLSAVHNLAACDNRVDRLITHRLTLVCGGQSRFTKTAAVLKEFDIAEQNVRLLRYRGYGNPGPLHIQTSDSRQYEKTYQELWADEAGWAIEPRCRLCPDALGEASDIAAADVWPGGCPTDDDAGFNGIIVRSQSGQALVDSAVAAGELVLGEPLTVAQLNSFQPHQINKKRALAARYQGLIDIGQIPVSAPQMRLEKLAKHLTAAEADQQRAGVQGRFRRTDSE